MLHCISLFEYLMWRGIPYALGEDYDIFSEMYYECIYKLSKNNNQLLNKIKINQFNN